MVWQNVTVGLKDRFTNGAPKIGDNITIYCSAIIIGDITIGNNSVIGAGSIVLTDVPDNTIVVGIWK